MYQPQDVVSFTKVRLPYGWMGNMSAYPIGALGETWRTAEHLFQALRFLDEGIRAEIRACKSPMTAKMIAKKHAHRMHIRPRSPEDLILMTMVTRIKFFQHPDLAEQLLSTGEAEIIEDVTNRQNESGLFWGAGRVIDGWVGQNHLGRILQQVRTELRANQPVSRQGDDGDGLVTPPPAIPDTLE